MPRFRAVVVEHGYRTTRHERAVIEAAGGEFIDAQDRPLEEALALCAEAEGVLVRRIELNADQIAAFRRCRIIVRYGVGTDNVDTQAATEAGIIVGNVPDYCTDEVSTHAIALMLACVRDVVATHGRMAAGDWDVRRPVPVHRMAGRTVGIVGLGQIGSAVARKLAPWGLHLIAADPFVEPEYARRLGVELMDFASLCRGSDILTLHVPLLPETRHLVGQVAFETMRPGAILVNTSRGPVVDTAALLSAFEAGRLARAGIDVYEEEPLPPDAPLRRQPRVVLTDHMAWYSEESQVQLQTSAARSIVQACRGGLPASMANPELVARMGRMDEWQPAPCMVWRLKRLGLLS